jgi:hypothetical protein
MLIEGRYGRVRTPRACLCWLPFVLDYPWQNELCRHRRLRQWRQDSALSRWRVQHTAWTDYTGGINAVFQAREIEHDSIVACACPLSERQEKLRLEVLTAKMRHEWATAEAERNGSSPALTKFIQESKNEYRALHAKLTSLELRNKGPKLRAGQPSRS